MDALISQRFLTPRGSHPHLFEVNKTALPTQTPRESKLQLRERLKQYTQPTGCKIIDILF